MPKKNWPYIWHAVAVFLLAPLAAWFFIAVCEQVLLPKNSYAIPAFEMTRTDTLVSVTAPLENTQYKISSSISEDATFTQTDLAQIFARYEQPSVLITRGRRTLKVWFDDVRVREVNQVDHTILYRHFQPYYYAVPQLADGRLPNILTVETLSEDWRPYLGTVYIGEQADILVAYRWRGFLGVSIVTFACGIAFMSALIAFSLALGAKDKRPYFSFGLVMACWTSINLDYIGPFSLLPAYTGRIIYAMSSFLLIVASLDFANTWTRKSRIVARWIVPIMTGALILVILPVLASSPRFYHQSLLTADAIAVIAVGIMLWQFFSAISMDKAVSRGQAFVYLFCIVVVMCDVLESAIPGFGKMLWPQTGSSLHYGPLQPALLGLTIISKFVSDTLGAQRTLRSANETLADTVAEREAEIAQVYEAREADMRDAALADERQRIMRDMHDGVGGRLLALSLLAKRDALEQDMLSDELDGSLQELRLIIDSMDTADGDLDMALGALRGRIEPMLRDAGIELYWDVEELGEHAAYGPREVLSIYRMLQEAASNVVRHAEAKKVIFATRRPRPGWLEISLRDDGTGFEVESTESASGKGLKNMQGRAEVLGGRLDISTPIAGGTCVTLSLPETPVELTGVTPWG